MVRNLNDSTERVSISSIEPHPDNPNRGDVAGIRSSIETVGWFGFVTCQKSTRRILIGEHRWLSLQAEGETEIDVLWLDCDDETAVEVMIADNEWSRRGRNDRKRLYDLLVGVMDRHETVEHVGVRDERFDVLEAEMRELAGPESASNSKVADASDSDDGPGEHAEPGDAPESFREYDDTAEEEYCCPSCGYEWSGRPR